MWYACTAFEDWATWLILEAVRCVMHCVDKVLVMMLFHENVGHLAKCTAMVGGRIYSILTHLYGMFPMISDPGV
jgi:hypothetical protein